MGHEMLAQHALFCIDSNTKKGTLSQQFVMHVWDFIITSCLQWNLLMLSHPRDRGCIRQVAASHSTSIKNKQAFWPVYGELHK